LKAREDRETAVREVATLRAQMQELVDDRLEIKVRAEEERERIEGMRAGEQGGAGEGGKDRQGYF
jgi:hypothetical protein